MGGVLGRAHGAIAHSRRERLGNWGGCWCWWCGCGSRVCAQRGHIGSGRGRVRVRDGRAAVVSTHAPANRRFFRCWVLGQSWHGRQWRCDLGRGVLLQRLFLSAPHAPVARDLLVALHAGRECCGTVGRCVPARKACKGRDMEVRGASTQYEVGNNGSGARV
jgi:hypothetical protein